MDKTSTQQFRWMIETHTAKLFRRTLCEVWGSYLSSVDNLPSNFREISRTMYMLISMFDIIEKRDEEFLNKMNEEIESINKKFNFNEHEKADN